MGGVAALICAISFGILMLAVVIVVFRLSKTVKITNGLLDDLRKQTIPLMTRVQTTMDHLNSELGYLDRIMGSLEKLAERVNSITKVAQRIVSSPLVRIIGLGAGVQQALVSKDAERVKEEKKEEKKEKEEGNE